MRPRHSFAVVAAATVLATPLAGLGPASAAPRSGRVAVPNAQPSAVRGARPVADAPAGQQVEVKVYLADRDTAALSAQLRAVTDPRSASYGHYLTPAQFRARYAPTTATVSAVRSYLRTYGLRTSEVPANHSYVAATGSVDQAERAFATSLKEYRLEGRRLRAASSAPTLPSALAGQVIAVSGLASHSQLMAPRRAGADRTARPTRTRATTQAPPPDAFVNAPPCSTYYGEKVATTLPRAYGSKQPYAPCGYVPAQLQGAYGLSRSVAQHFDGRGVTVAITDAYAAPTIRQDANTYARRHGQPTFERRQLRQVLPNSYRYGYDDTVNGDLCGEQGWYGEETLDVEAVHAMAPGANVTYVASRSCDNADFARTLNKVVDRHLADIVTNSWGGTDESNGSAQLDRVYQQVFFQAALQGIGMYFSSGDSGDGAADNNGTPTVQAPANSPLVTAVGGTSLAVGRKDQRLFETGWSTSRSSLVDGAWTPPPPGNYLYGGGGGTSRVFAEPWYQQGVVPASLAKRYGPAGRVVPDISMVGDPTTGMLVGETQTFPDGTVKYSEYRIGGTSLSSPLFAGVMAIADQVYGRPHGFANPAIYQLYDSRRGSRALYDPRGVNGKALVRVDYVNGVDDADGTVTSLRTIDAKNDTILRARRGYDDITGVGSPKGEAFVSSIGYDY